MSHSWNLSVSCQLHTNCICFCHRCMSDRKMNREDMSHRHRKYLLYGGRIHLYIESICRKVGRQDNCYCIFGIGSIEHSNLVSIWHICLFMFRIWCILVGENMYGTVNLGESSRILKDRWCSCYHYYIQYQQHRCNFSSVCSLWSKMSRFFYWRENTTDMGIRIASNICC